MVGYKVGPEIVCLLEVNRSTSIRCCSHEYQSGEGRATGPPPSSLLLPVGTLELRARQKNIF